MVGSHQAIIGLKDRRDPLSGFGLLIAPLAAAPAAAFHFALWHRELSNAYAALYAALLILPLSFFLTLFVGVPYLYGMQRLGILNILSMTVGGLLLGLAVGFGIGVILFPLWDWYARFFYVSLGALCGLAVSLAYWLIWFMTRRR